MKNLIVIAFLFVFASAGFAQNSSSYDATFKSSETYLITDIEGSSRDTIGVGDSTWTYTTRLYQPSKLFYDFYVSLDSVGGTTSDVVVTLNGRDMSVDDWTQIATSTWSTGADTTINFEQFTTAQPYKDYQVKVVAASDEFNVKIARFIQRFLLD